MATGEDINIIIIADQSPRAEVLASMIAGCVEVPAEITVIRPADVKITEDTQNVDLCIIDLMSSDGPVLNTITNLRDNQPQAKIIALHIYKTPELVKPLYDIGINGYLFHDLSRKDLAAALDVVLNGGVYVPAFLALS